MTKRDNPIARRRSLTLGLVGFSRISAVEGVRLDADSKRMFANFERRGLTDAERRCAIYEKHAKKA
ncbi:MULTISPECIES: hypothetical protein [unclassified Methylosinus]|uniref:hypothetical protein n=1 Tax=unclassified Methylosinus TaxID=2624500 RepID=UPI0010652DC9|nr:MULTISPECIES: hypothetical protein [unclassified Methylosinus]